MSCLPDNHRWHFMRELPPIEITTTYDDSQSSQRVFEFVCEDCGETKEVIQ